MESLSTRYVLFVMSWEPVQWFVDRFTDPFVVGRVDQSWLERFRESVLESSEFDVLARRVGQLQELVCAMARPAALPGSVPSVSYVSDDIFEFGGVVDMTGCSSGQQRSSAVDDEVFMSFPVGWTSGMKDVYMALVCRSSGHGVGVQELAGWVDLPEEGVRECLRGLVQAGKVVSVGGLDMFACVWGE